MSQILRSVKRVSVKVVEKEDDEMGSDENDVDSKEDGEQQGKAREIRKSKCITIQPLIKCRRILRISKKKHAMQKGTNKLIFDQRNGKFARSAKRTSALLI